MDHPAHRFEHLLRLGCLWVGPAHLGDNRPHQGHIGQIIQCEQTRANPIVNIVIVISDVVGQSSYLGFGPGVGIQLQVLVGAVFHQSGRQRRANGAVMLGNSFQAFPCQV